MLIKASPDDKAYKAWLDRCLQISTATAAIETDVTETAQARENRIKDLLKPRNFEKFCKYYFPHYIDADFAWFHHQAGKEILTKEDLMAALEWPREHAKSVIVDVFIPMNLKATGQLTGMILASETDDKAAILLGDLQAELMENKRFIADFGEQRTLGSWTEGHFTTTDGIGFWSFGLGQNPAGVRTAGKRPNYCVVDDAANKRRARNQERIKEDVDWVLGTLLGCLAIKASRIVFANNRTCSDDLMAHLVGDVKEGDPIREGLIHIKVFATEDPKTRKMLLIEEGGVPSWSQRYTVEHLKSRIKKMGFRNAMRNFYHIDMKDGDIFKEEDLPWAVVQALDQYDALITYNDPSYKDAKKNDTKAIVLVGKHGSYYDILWAWVRHASRKSMVQAHYRVDDIVKGRVKDPDIKRGKRDNNCPHYMEANFIQEDLFMGEYKNEGHRRKEQLRIRSDKRVKPDKVGRIEDLHPIAESGCLRFNKAKQKDPDMITLRDQFLSFPNGHDDGPDAVEGAIHLLNKKHKNDGRKRETRAGKYRRPSSRLA
jgi:predicted phage terminase large subunit-like protein